MKGHIDNPPPGTVIGRSAAEALASHLGRGEPITDAVQANSVQDIIDAIQGPTVESVAAASLGARKSKYRNVKTVVDGITFASKKEAKRYQILKAMEAAGQITDLELQPEYNLVVKGTIVAKYIGDFRYRKYARTTIVVEDVKSKGTKTPIYRLKKKMMFAQYGIEIQEI